MLRLSRRHISLVPPNPRRNVCAVHFAKSLDSYYEPSENSTDVFCMDEVRSSARVTLFALAKFGFDLARKYP